MRERMTYLEREISVLKVHTRYRAIVLRAQTAKFAEARPDRQNGQVILWGKRWS